MSKFSLARAAVLGVVTHLTLGVNFGDFLMKKNHKNIMRIAFFNF
jgi:hypothetical protein